MTYLLTTAKLDATSYKWLAAFSTFSFNLQYRAGRQNLDADGLSRCPQPELVNDHSSQKEHECTDQFVQRHLSDDGSPDYGDEVVKAICERHLVHQETQDCPSLTLVESLALYPDAVPDYFEKEESGLPVIPQLTDT